MTTLNIVPAASVNGIAFGTDRAECEATFGTPARTFKKNKWAKGETADYGDFHLCYDANGLLEAVEVFEGAIELPNGKLLIPSGTDAVLKSVPSLVSDSFGLTSETQSIGASVEDGMVTSILFGRAAYYA